MRSRQALLGVLVRSPGEHDDRHRRELGIGKPLDHPEALDDRQVQVENDKIGGDLGDLAYGPKTVAGPFHRETQIAATQREVVRDDDVVVDNDDRLALEAGPRRQCRAFVAGGLRLHLSTPLGVIFREASEV